MKPVRIYLSVLKNHEWNHTVYREIQALRNEWSSTIGDALWEVCAIHIGHDRPDYTDENLAELLAMQPKPVILTEAAKWGLPANLSNCSIEPVATCKFIGKDQPCALYIALEAWGYRLDASKLVVTRFSNQTPEYEMEGWLADFVSQFPNTLGRLQSAGIYDELSYLKNVHRLDEDLSAKVGNYRFNSYKPVKDITDPFAVLSICPEWLLNCTINRINLTVRLRNVFVTENIQFVRDITHMSAERLLRIPNMGRKSMRDLAEALILAFNQHAQNPNMLMDGVEEVCLYEHLEKTLNELPEAPQKIITARLGADGTTPQTLQTLGEMFGVTRERIRQIEKKYITTIIERESWDDLIHKKLSSLLRNRSNPLYLDMLSAEDNWFRGFDDKLEFLREVIVRFSEERIKVFTFEGRDIISTIDQTEFNSLGRKIRSTVSKNIGSDWTKARIEKLVETECLGHGVSALKLLLWEPLLESLHFASRDGEEILVGMGYGADNIVSIVLEEATEPLHYSEIHSRANKISENPLDIRRVHGCLTAKPDAKLFNRGIYGLRRHLNIDPTTATEIISEVEEIISNGLEFKQWHVSELLQILFDEANDLADKINNYELGILLEDSKNLISLGKQIWVSKHRDGLSTNDRIQTQNAIITVLEDAGRPLKSDELIERASRYRGMKANVQIHATDKLIKLMPSLWGLAHRDMPFTPDEKEEYLLALLDHLNKSKVGIHISEIPAILQAAGTSYPTNESPFIFFSVCAKDTRFKTWQGQLIGLADWQTAKRDSVASAFRKVLSSITHPMTASEIQIKLEDMLGRPLTRIKVSGLLSNSEAIYDKTTDKWTTHDAKTSASNDQTSYQKAVGC